MTAYSEMPASFRQKWDREFDAKSAQHPERRYFHMRELHDVWADASARKVCYNGMTFDLLRDLIEAPIYHDGDFFALRAEMNDREYVEQYAIHHRWLRGEIDAPTHDAGRWS